MNAQGGEVLKEERVLEGVIAREGRREEEGRAYNVCGSPVNEGGNEPGH